MARDKSNDKTTGDGLDVALAQINKQYGDGSIFNMGDDYRVDVEVVSTGAINLDVALGAGGLPRGRVVEVYGPESCLDAATFVQYEMRTAEGVGQNHKGGSIETLFHRFHEIPRPVSADSEYFASCMNGEGRIFQNRIVDVVDTGIKTCFTILTKGGSITATADHKFFRDGAFVPLSELRSGESIFIHNNTNFSNEGKESDRQYDYVVVEDEILDICEVGERQTYDIRMESPFNNFIADGYVVHNSGKTTLSLHCIANAQAQGLTCAFVDVEHALDPVYAAAIGVDMEAMLVSQPDSGEEALNIVEILTRSGEVGVIVIDSVAALTPRAEIEGDMGDTHIGLQARLMSQALRKLTGVIAKTNTLVIFINQLREKPGVLYGSPEVTSGGKALKFYASVRLDIRRREALKNGSEVIGNTTRVKVVKNKVGAPFKEAEFDIFYGRGIDGLGSLIDLGVDLGVVKKSGAWYSYNDTIIGQGRAASSESLGGDEVLRDEIIKIVRAAANGGVLE